MPSINVRGGSIVAGSFAINCFREALKVVAGWATGSGGIAWRDISLELMPKGGIYDFQFKGDGYQGRYYAASGLTYGYAKQIARHLSFEFSLGIGYLTTEYKKYTPYEGDLVWKSSARYNFIGPTKAKVSLVWLITARR